VDAKYTSPSVKLLELATLYTVRHAKNNRTCDTDWSGDIGVRHLAVELQKNYSLSKACLAVARYTSTPQMPLELATLRASSLTRAKHTHDRDASRRGEFDGSCLQGMSNLRSMLTMRNTLIVCAGYKMLYRSRQQAGYYLPIHIV
jgi:hypothetical protein